MATCSNCNNEVSQGASFCPICGADLNQATGQLVRDNVLEGRYIIIKTLGRGGMGAVYLALDERLDNTLVAVKEMSTNAVKGNLQVAIDAFKKEAAILNKLKHQALPTIKDFFQSGNRWYLVMEYIKGETLKDIAKKRGPIPEAEVKAWTRQLCDILEYLHSQNPPIIFRDLKPANIMLDPDGSVKLIDFGIARHFRPGGAADTVAYGSLGFASPEQYGQNQTDERSDIYSLGATLRSLLTGLEPENGPSYDSPDNVITADPNFNFAIKKALSLNPVERPKNISEFRRLCFEERTATNTDSTQEFMATLSGPNIQIEGSGYTPAIQSAHQVASPVQVKKPGRTGLKIAIFIIFLLAFGGGSYYFGSTTAKKNVESQPAASSATQTTVNNTIATNDAVNKGAVNQTSQAATTNAPTGQQYMSDILQPYFKDLDEFKTNENITVAGKKYYKNYYMYPWNFNSSTTVSFNLSGQYSRITGLIGFVDGANSFDNTIIINGDGNIITTYELKAGTLPQNLDLKVVGVNKLDITIRYPGMKSCPNAVVICDPIIQ